MGGGAEPAGVVGSSAGKKNASCAHGVGVPIVGGGGGWWIGC